MSRLINVSVALLAMASIAFSSPSLGRAQQGHNQANPGQSLDLDAWIKQLGDHRFAKRQQAYRHLLQLGEAGLPEIRRAAAGRVPDAERRHRLQQLMIRIHQQVVLDGFIGLSLCGDQLDLEEAMWWICRIDHLACDRQQLERQLEELAEAVRKHLGAGPPPSRRAPKEVVEAMVEVLFRQRNFKGSVSQYDHPDNSLLHKVLERREGLPILLSHLVVSVAERLDVPIVGLQIPGRYMVKYDGSRAPEGFPQDDIILDPFGGGRILTVAELRALIPGVDASRHLEPSDPRATVARMLRNLASDYAVVGNNRQATFVRRLVGLIEARSP